MRGRRLIGFEHVIGCAPQMDRGRHGHIVEHANSLILNTLVVCQGSEEDGSKIIA